VASQRFRRSGLPDAASHGLTGRWSPFSRMNATRRRVMCGLTDFGEGGCGIMAAMRKIGFLVLSAVLAVVGIVYAVVPFAITVQGAVAPEQPTVSECSAPVLQVVDPPNPSVGSDGIRDFPPVCKDAGRSRMLTSVALVIAAALAAIVALTGRGRDDSGLGGVLVLVGVLVLGLDLKDRLDELVRLQRHRQLLV